MNRIEELSKLAPIEVLNDIRNRYYADGNSTEMGIVANALNEIFPRMVVPPCKVGDTVYMVRPCQQTIVSMTVIQIEYDRSNLWIRADDGIMYCVRPYSDYCYSLEEAEEKLNEIKTHQIKRH